MKNDKKISVFFLLILTITLNVFGEEKNDLSTENSSSLPREEDFVFVLTKDNYFQFIENNEFTVGE
jgi:hypothetical protein